MTKKEKRCDPDDPEDAQRGDCWDHVALDPEHRLILAVVPGKRTAEHCRQLVQEVHDRTHGRADVLLTSDAYPPYREAIAQVYGRSPRRRRAAGLGRRCCPGGCATPRSASKSRGDVWWGC